MIGHLLPFIHSVAHPNPKNTALITAIAKVFEIYFQIVCPDNLLQAIGQFLGKMNTAAGNVTRSNSTVLVSPLSGDFWKNGSRLVRPPDPA